MFYWLSFASDKMAFSGSDQVVSTQQSRSGCFITTITNSDYLPILFSEMFPWLYGLWIACVFFLCFLPLWLLLTRHLHQLKEFRFSRK